MKKNIRIAAKAALSLLILLVLGFIGLVIYAKYFYNRDVKVVSIMPMSYVLERRLLKRNLKKSIKLLWTSIHCILPSI